MIGPARGLMFFAVILMLPFMNLEHWVMNMAVYVLMFAIMSSAWNLLGGFTGYPSLGHAAFFGLGAYTSAIWFQDREVTSGFEPFLVLPLVGLFAAVVGLPIAWIAMRTRLDVFAIVTITVLFIAQTLAYNLRELTGGSAGIAMPIAPFEPDTFERPFYLVLALLLAVSMGVTWASMNSKVGLSLVAVRADEDKAVGIGVHVTAVKLAAFCVSVAMVAMVGGVWAYYQSFIYPPFAFDPLITVAIVLMTFLGGRGTLWGPVIGAFILQTAQQVLAYQLGGSQLYLVAYALVFLVVMLLLPQGIVPTISNRLGQRRREHGDPAAATRASPAISGSSVEVAATNNGSAA